MKLKLFKELLLTIFFKISNSLDGIHFNIMIFHWELWKFFHLLYESGTEILVLFQMSPFLFHHSLSKDWTMYVPSFDQTMNFNQGHIQCQLIGCENLLQIKLPGIMKWGKEDEKWNPFMWLSTGLLGYLHYN